MRHHLAVGLTILLSGCAPTEGTLMEKPLLAVKATCRENDSCLYEGKDLFLDIRIVNPQEVEIGFPLEFMRSTGPIIRLIDTRTQADTYLKNNLADFALEDKFVVIPPGESVSLEWVITSGELEQFGGPYVDVSAEITIMATIQVGGKKVEFRGADTLRIVDKNKPSG